MNTNLLLNQTETCSQETSDFESTNSLDSFSKNTPLEIDVGFSSYGDFSYHDGQWVLGGTSFRVSKPVFIIPKHFIRFAIIATEHCENLVIPK